MSARVVAWAGWSAAVVFAAGGAVFYALAPSVEFANSSREVGLLFSLVGLAFATVGALVTARRAGNRIGWLLLFVGLTLQIGTVASGYAAYGLVAHPGALPGAEIAAWLQSWIWVPSIGFTTTLLFLLFPDGRLPSRRWIPVAALGALAGISLMLYSLLEPGPIEEFPGVDNPFGVASVQDVFSVGWLLLPLGALLSAASLVARYRRAGFEERLQLKWFASAAALFAAAITTGFFSSDAGLSPTATEALVVVGATALPIAIGIAVFKHGLYEIDVIIRRTLVYGVLSAGLAGLYFGVVIGLQAAFSSFTQGNELAVAGSTLAVAALFRPARRRIQALVDRRFYRSKVDAARTLDAFSARLRREIDLDSLAAELGAVVERTVQPAHVSVWLKPQEADR